MPRLEKADLEGWILDKLSRHGHWEARHTSFDNIPKGAPTHMHKEISEAAKELVRCGLIRIKPTSYGQEVSLNFARKDEIYAIIEKWKMKGAND
ncbi:Uncharacterised protein [Candidatus Burarchaeum australiense]|nr:Uncharacterised protein [Candidatus Burarchaeum australiense]